jgi:hypothetical protein
MQHSPRRELPAEKVFLQDGMGFFGFAAPFIGKGDQSFSLPVHI